MNNQTLKEILKSRGVRRLYHANSVLTSLTYLRAGGLLSREAVEDRGLPQSDQQTDKTDRLYGIYNDVFFDSVDIHERAHFVNHYGPVTFVYDLDVIDDLGAYEIAVTKSNPQSWGDDLPYSKRYFTSEEELKGGFVLGDFGQHITVRNISEPIGFSHLESVLIESPGIHKKHLTIALNEIQKELDCLGVNISARVRNCLDSCGCQKQYNSKSEGYTYYRYTITSGK